MDVHVPKEEEGLPCWALVFLVPVLIALSPLLIVEAIILFFTDCALPPLSCGCVKSSPVKGTFPRSTFPPQNQVPENLLSKTTQGINCGISYITADCSTIAENVDTICQVMLEANNVSATKSLPEELAGIFWMKDNSVPEELACLTYGAWSLDGQPPNTYTRVGNYTGWTYLNNCLGKLMSPFDGTFNSGGLMWFCFLDQSLKYGRIYGSGSDDYEKLSGLMQLGKWTLERKSGTGVAWKRGCYWLPAWFGNRLEMGSYTLTKIMAANGQKVQPAYDEYVKYMVKKHPNSRNMLSVNPSKQKELGNKEHLYQPLQQDSEVSTSETEGPLQFQERTLLSARSSQCESCCKLLSCCCISSILVAVLVFIACSVGFHLQSNALPVIDENNGDPYVAWWNMPVRQSIPLQKRLQRKLTPLNQTEHEIFEKAMPDFLKGKAIWGKASGADMADIMYKGTHIRGVVDHVPEKLRGVYWMHNNGAPEELVVLQYGRWFKDVNTYIQPMSPFMWSWPASVPSEAPYNGALYKVGLGPTVMAAIGMTSTPGSGPTSLSYKFGHCPNGAQYCNPSSSDPMAYADMQAHAESDVRTVLNFGDLITAIASFLGLIIPEDYLVGTFTLQEMNGVKPGSLYKRACSWGVGRCDCIEFGSYNLTKILDEHGTRIEPYYTEFASYIQDVMLFTWAGFKDKRAEDSVIEYYKQTSKGVPTDL